MKVFRGTLVHCRVPEKIEILPDHLIGFDEARQGQILFVERCSDLEQQAETHGFDLASVHSLAEGQFLLPGFVDTHIHAPQYKNTGTGYDRMLLEWLRHYTFPTEARFEDLEVAKQLYPMVVRRTLRNGTTTASYFATIHLPASQELCKVIAELGQRAFVGKVNMDRESPEYYVEETQQSLDDTRRFVEYVQAMKNPLVQPILTPRFPISCSPALLRGLGELASETGVRVQSHLCEQKPEVEFILRLFPDHSHCASIFEKNKLFGDKALMAHCVHLEEEDLELVKRNGVGVAHCPTSNLCICSGIMDARRVLQEGIVKIGLGTDVSGGFSPSLLEVMRAAVHSSKALSFSKPEGYTAISHHEALYMATLGGARVLTIDDRIGNFEVGKEFDALLIDTRAPLPFPVFDTFEQDTMDDILMKFFYLGDDRNIVKVFVAGREIKLE